MKRTIMILAVSAIIAMAAGSAMAEGLGVIPDPAASVKAGFPDKDIIRIVKMPTDINKVGVVTSLAEGVWPCGDSAAEIGFRDYAYAYAVSTPELTKWNAGKVAISGAGSWSFGRTTQQNGHLSFDVLGKTTFIDFARKNCWQNFSQEYDAGSDQWICVVEQEYTCEDVNYSDSGLRGQELILTIPTYGVVR